MRRPLTIEGRRYEVPVAAGRSRLVLFERGGGRLLAVTGGEAIHRFDTGLSDRENPLTKTF